MNIPTLQLRSPYLLFIGAAEDEPLLQAEDCANGIVCECGVMQPFTTALWG